MQQNLYQHRETQLVADDEALSIIAHHQLSAQLTQQQLQHNYRSSILSSPNDNRGSRSIFVIGCPKSMVGRVIGKNGETIKALQKYTGSLIQVNQLEDPCQITVSGTMQSLSLSVPMVSDIINGSFKGFALLRQLAAISASNPVASNVMTSFAHPETMMTSSITFNQQEHHHLFSQQQHLPTSSTVIHRPVYAPGYGLIPPTASTSHTSQYSQVVVSN
jgi:hypothetical protein